MNPDALNATANFDGENRKRHLKMSAVAEGGGLARGQLVNALCLFSRGAVRPCALTAQLRTEECFVRLVAPDFSGAAFKSGTHELLFLLKAGV